MGLSRRTSQLPLTAISLGLQAWECSRGVREFTLRRADEALQIAAHTPLGRLLPKQIFNDRADEEAALIVSDAREAMKPGPTPTPAPHQPAAAESEAAREVGAPGAMTQEVEEIAEHLHVEPPETRAELPIPDFDNISIGSLRARLRSLSVEQLVVLREWEQEHAHRLVVITTLDNRIAKLTGTDAGGTAGGATGGLTREQHPSGTSGQTDVGAGGTGYPQEAVAAERTAEDNGGTLRV